MKKRIVSLVVAMSMLLSITAVMPIVANANCKISIGQYITMGRYNDMPIIWRCVDIDEYGPLMLTDEVISVKSFDALGDDLSGSHGKMYTIGSSPITYRDEEGSNYWPDSNLRCWLNSEDYEVTYSCGNPPTADKCIAPYDNEAGFLTNFTRTEKNAIKTVTQKLVLPTYESGINQNPGGTGVHTIDKCNESYDENSLMDVTDKVFPLDVHQLYTVYKNSNILGDGYCFAKLTKQAEEKVSGTLKFLNPSKCNYWLRTPQTFGATSGESIVYKNEGVTVAFPAKAEVGVRPAFYLDTSKCTFSKGEGTKASPYTVAKDDTTFFTMKKNGWAFVNSAISFDYQDCTAHETHDGDTPKACIPVERWIEVFGESAKPFADQIPNKHWGGSCFGMCLSAIAMFGGYTDSTKYMKYSVHSQYKKMDGYLASPNDDITELIEKAQISQFSTERKNAYGNFKDLVERIMDGEVFPISYNVDGKNGGGHCIMTDTWRGVDYLGDGWYKIFMYDPNYPYFEDYEDNCGRFYSKYSNWYKRSVQVNVITDEWYLDTGFGNTQNDKIDGSRLCYLENADLYKNHPDFTGYTMRDGVFVTGQSLSLCADSGEELLNVQNGKIVSQADSIDVEILSDATATDYVADDTFNPKGELNAVIQLNKAKLGKATLNNSAVTSIENNVIKQISSQGSANADFNNLSVTSDKNSDVSILLETKQSADKFDALKVKGTLNSGEKISISKDKSGYKASSNSSNSFDVTTYKDTNESTESKLLNGKETQSQAKETDKDEFSFSDLQKGDEYYTEFKKLYELGIIDGYEDGTIRPYNMITRAEISKLIISTLGERYIEEAKANMNKPTVFGDVPTDHWASGYIKVGFTDGYINGMGDGIFAPEENVTFAQAVKLIVSAAGYEEEAQNLGGWPDGYILKAEETGISDNVQAPSDINTSIPRGDVARLLYNWIMLTEN